MHATREREKFVARQEIQSQLNDVAEDREEARRQATIQGEKPDGSGVFNNLADYDDAIQSFIPDLTVKEQQDVAFVRSELEKQERSQNRLTDWDNSWLDSYDNIHTPECLIFH